MRRSLFILVVAMMIAALLYSMALTPYIGDGYDDGRYVTLGRSLASGQGLGQFQAPENPPETQYPPVYPMLLGLVWLVAPVFPANAVAFKLVSVIAALAFVALTYGWMRWRGEGTTICLLVALFTLFNPQFLGYATAAFSEMTYGAIVVLAIWLVERYARREPFRWRDAVVPSVAVAAALYTRTLGITLVLAAAIYLALQRDKRRALAFAGVTALLIAPWFIRSALLPRDVWGYSQQLLLKSMEQPELGVVGLGDLAVRVILNVRAYLLAGLPGAVFPSQVPLTYVNLADGLRLGAPFAASDVILAAVMAGAVIGQLLMRRALVDWYVMLYLGMAIFWPWEPTRFVVPLIPFLYGYLFFELGMFGEAAKRFPGLWRVVRFASLGAAALFIVANVAVQSGYVMSLRGQVAPSSDWQARLRLYDWIDRNTAPDAVLAAMNDPQLYLYTGRKVARNLDSAAALRAQGVGYVVLVPYGGVLVTGDLSRMRFMPVYRADPDAYAQVYADESAGIQVYQVKCQCKSRWD